MSLLGFIVPFSKWAGSSAVLVATTTATINLVPKYLPPSDQFRWVESGQIASECASPDSNYTVETEPVLQCTVKQENTVAICWDGKSFTNAKGGKGCSYKPLKVDQCTSGAANGVLWVCKDTTRN